jgi:hypothetical protein
MRWDDIELLRLINELEDTETGWLIDGHRLMERAGRGKQIDWQKDQRPFARELLLARDRSYINFDDRGWLGQPMANPEIDPNLWLQQIRDIHITLEGRDRALCRVFQKPPPDPQEDDGRLISQTTLAAIAKTISDTYSESQLPVFLAESGIPAEFLDVQAATKMDYVLHVMTMMLEKGSASRRSLRTFIGSWLTDRFVTGPSDEERDTIASQLARQGWHVHEDRLVVGAPSTVPVKLKTASEPAQICLNGHPINFHFRSQPQTSKSFCPNCGERTITECPSCQKDIPGEDTVVYPYCKYCGKPYPWAEKRIQAAKQLIREQGLAEEEEVEVTESIDALVQRSADAPLAEQRLKGFMRKVAPQVADSLKAILVDVLSESIKKTIWGTP